MSTPVDTEGITVLSLPLADPRVRPLLDELAMEYETRYADLFGAGNAAAELNKYPAEEFAAPDGAVLILQENSVSVADGAFRRYSSDTAEFKASGPIHSIAAAGWRAGCWRSWRPGR